VLIAALAALSAVSTTAQTVRPKIDVVLQLANSLSEDEPYGVNPTALAFSPDQRRVASGDTNGVVKLWNAADGRLIRTIGHPQLRTIGYPQQVTAVAFTADGRRLVTVAGTISTSPSGAAPFLPSQAMDCVSSQEATMRPPRNGTSPPDARSKTTWTTWAAARLLLPPSRRIVGCWRPPMTAA
jgi:WD40 repeat protein